MTMIEGFTSTSSFLQWTLHDHDDHDRRIYIYLFLLQWTLHDHDRRIYIYLFLFTGDPP